MGNGRAKLLVFGIGVLVLFGGGLYILLREPAKAPAPAVVEEVTEPPTSSQSVIGTSVEGRPISAYTFGTGDTELLFVGGIHGGYEWNSVLLAYTFIDYLEANPSIIPPHLSITVIPSANPDGVFKVIGTEGRFVITDVPAIDQSAGRFNAHKVDLNRNFACKWQATSTWRSLPVSAGSCYSRFGYCKNSGSGCLLAQPIKCGLCVRMRKRHFARNAHYYEYVCNGGRLSCG